MEEPSFDKSSPSEIDLETTAGTDAQLPVPDPHLRQRKRRATFREQHLANRLNLDDVLELTERCEKSASQQWHGLCPAHVDSDPSLAISVDGNGKLLLHCHAGCSFEAIVEAFKCRRNKRSRANESGDSHRSQPIEQLSSLRARAVRQPPAGRVHYVNAAGAIRDWAAQSRRFEKDLSRQELRRLSRELGVSPASLRSLNVGRSVLYGRPVYTFPEFNAQGEVLGIATRDLDGSKSFLADGKRGLYLPSMWNTGSDDLLICEGATDTAAGLTMGLNFIGRSSARGGVQLLAELLARFPRDRVITILGENDEKEDGRCPGKEGAERVARELERLLRRPITVSMPPPGVKDVRAFLRHEAERASLQRSKRG